MAKIDINQILKRPVNKGCTKYGADMGRRNQPEGEPDSPLYLQKLRFVDGDYDTGGAYWGSGDPIWCAFSEEFAKSTTTADDSLRIFVRARTREEAKKLVAEQFKEDGFSFID